MAARQADGIHAAIAAIRSRMWARIAEAGILAAYHGYGGTTRYSEAFDQMWGQSLTDPGYNATLSQGYSTFGFSIPGGSIINASSMYALTGTPNRDAYTAAKGGITALTRSMAVEFAKHKIRVNAVAPGWIETAMARRKASSKRNDVTRRLAF